MEFEWDENKNASNLQKHGIAFEDAAKIFLKRRIENSSDRANEKRFITIGEINNRVIAVIYTLRENKIRIISARKARKNEEKEYRKI
ncbi:MAG: BrnT family toxin [Calditrichaeota bacterium]|nr:MAG: BrnT family toxin [Calditrichota bacterium]